VALLAAAAVSVAAIVLDQSRWPYWLSAVIVLVFFWYALKLPAPESREERLKGTALLVCLAASGLWITADSFLDRYKSFVPFVEELQTQAQPSTPLYAYLADGTTLAVVEFYTGRHANPVGLDEVKSLAHQSATNWLIVRDSATGGNYAAISHAGVPHRLVFEKVIGNDRTMRILALGNELNDERRQTTALTSESVRKKFVRSMQKTMGSYIGWITRRVNKDSSEEPDV
jgi:hypothetical protein